MNDWNTCEEFPSFSLGVWLEGVEDGGADQQVGEGADHQGQGAHILPLHAFWPPLPHTRTTTYILDIYTQHSRYVKSATRLAAAAAAHSHTLHFRFRFMK